MMHGMLGKCRRWSHNKGIGLLVLRIALGAFFIGHSIAKLQSLSGTVAMFGQWHISAFWAYVETFVELLAGVAFVLGAFLWIAGPAIVISMAVAVFAVLLPGLKENKVPFLQGFIFGWGPNLVYAAAAIALSFTGAGRYSLAAWWMRRRNVKCRDCRMDHGMNGCDQCEREHAAHIETPVSELEI